MTREGVAYAAKILQGVTHLNIGTETAHPHGLGRAPSHWSIKSKANGVVYESATPADETNIYVKGSAASLEFEAVCYS